MRHLKSIDKKNFYKEPINFDKHTNKNLLKYAVGSNLYMNALMDIENKIILKKLENISSITICFEDAIKESDVENGEKNLLRALDIIYDYLKLDDNRKDEIPLIFIRVRNINQFLNFTSKLSEKQMRLITGFTFPKFNISSGKIYLEHLLKLNNKFNEKIYAMPILETEEIIYKETRVSEGIYLKKLLWDYKDLILNIRVGGTDFSSKFGIRRSSNRSIYDIGVINDCLIDIINIFGRSEDDYIISAPVWEYFSSDINSKEVKGLIREIELDKENGFCGKTIIHPTQGLYVNAIYSVKFEDYIDAMDILNFERTGGVFKGYNNNKMNEVLPHYNWAKRIYHRAQVFGVMNKNLSYNDLFRG
ncbi:HpcH/HpaI aldolase/citrate lyase family protein [Clostridium ihumii]|uniref:HpcH/HpaI aldolase/citrate lyase family protein n=1 Tax=Clostridium ihumii TaxID=1470356 RepID=UPI00058F5F2D|nr:HpcH/HpaI aldolase/citrate lyase family protein [Clostridium ihumii]